MKTLAPELNLPVMSDDITYTQAKAMIEAMTSTTKEYETWLSAAAVKYGVSVDIGDYGSGRFVANSEQLARSYGVSVGDWVSSSSTC